MTLPDDRSDVTTEQRHVHVLGDGLDTRRSGEVIAMIARAQADACLAVASQAQAIEGFVDAVVEGMSRGGRLLYLGTGTSGRLGVLEPGAIRGHHHLGKYRAHCDAGNT